MHVGLDALKVVLRDLNGALFRGATLGNFTDTLEKALEWSLNAWLASTTQVLMI